MREIIRAIAVIAVCFAVARIPAVAAESPADVSIGPPTGVATDAIGNVYFSSTSIVYRLDRVGTLGRVAGNGEPGYSGDGGPAAAAKLNIPFDNYPELAQDFIDFGPLVGPLAVDASGNLYIGDAYNNRVRRVDTNGIISTVLGDGPSGYPVLIDAPTAWPQGLAVDAAGNLYVVGAWGRLARVSREGLITLLAGPQCDNFANPGLCGPGQIAVDSSGNTYVPDDYCRVRKVSADHEVVTVAGNEVPNGKGGFAHACGYSGDGGPAIGAALSGPFAVALDGAGSLYIADTGNDCIRKVDSAGVITTYAGVCLQAGFSGDGGPATAARLNKPFGVTADAAGNLYIADTYNYRIRKVSTDGRIVTVAGNGNPVAEAIPTVAIPASAVAIGSGFTGAWFDPAQSGHGLFIEVLPSNRFYAAWFAFDPSGSSQAWFAGVGTYSGNTATITAVEQPAGGRWIPNFDPSQVVVNQWGTLAFTFTDCNHGKVDFNSVLGYGAGSMNLTRLTQPAGLSCP
jgi:hypothetical protein